MIGKRKRVSRLVTVDGYKVFKSNLYSLEDGERSVWEQELGPKIEEELEEQDTTGFKVMHLILF